MRSTSDPAAARGSAPARLRRRDLLTLGVSRPIGDVDRGPDADAPGHFGGATAPADANRHSDRAPDRLPGAPALDGGLFAFAADHWIRVSRVAMACRFEVTLAGEHARHVPLAREALSEADRLEASLSVFRDTSDLVRINRTAGDGPVDTDPELFELLALCRDLHARTGGAFDPTSTPLSRCWGFMARQGHLPSQEELANARARIGMDAVALDPTRRTVHLTRPAMELNLGSIGKGYAVQRIADYLAVRGVRHALVSAGSSSVVAVGGRRDGWPIDLCSRQRGGARLARLHLRHGALGTSGAGEQFFEVGGRRYGHVLDPRTGWPASGVVSASVVCGDGAEADALATAFLVGGLDLAHAYCSAHPQTLALITVEGGQRPEEIGAYAGAVVEDL